MNKREFIKKACIGASAAIAAPYVIGAKNAPIKWRLQTYAGPALAEHVIKPSIDAFNKAANGEMVIELYCADQLVPTSELFRAMQAGTIDAVQSDDDSIASPADVAVFGGYFPFATRYSLDIPTLFYQFGLDKIWEESYNEIKGVTWLSAGAWDPCHFATKAPVNKLADLKGKKVYTFPTAGRFLSRFGVVPVTLPYEDCEMALRTGELDGVAWSGITEDYTVGWADVTNYFLTNNIAGAWCGSYFANTKSWEKVPDHLKTLFKLCMDSSHYYRQYWYWGGEAKLRVQGPKLKLTTIPDEEWKTVEDEAVKFWDEIAKTSPRAAKVVQIFKDYNAMMSKAGRPYRG
ncbi:MAG TPA: TRAP transporter substrate-binding protein [Opitutaceae bacterium]|jgi:TRAP-type mannitol/chloroaromatic compound transport system substrate-binding protein|nr:TRAP transporter substrate-binding protein DctP [Opitutaceae bacterium]OQB96412.1 MAG: Monocarboxylate 2-oxoacid-binding periplasmic protein precursor [Verrucomicrobia bacterium ADurb.Bin122]HOD45802.1 TRAP transporter substrate-binding protein [Opitutaceae bacterium]HOF10172.1 TRAP transporter substrate-binding protein [Opitutaceae bacterium]HOR24060.1 TRAP transporter substrate-binding protein [Opitutaceae bacterium]